MGISSYAVAGVLGVLGMMGQGQAAEVTVLTNMGVVSAVRDLAPAFERATGHKVIVQFEIGPAFMQKINANAPADIVTQSPEGMEELIRRGKVVAGTGVSFARAGIGVVVKAGTPKPDIGTPDALKRTLLAAKSIAYSNAGASGVVMAQIVERLGLAAELKDRTRRVDGRPIAELVAKGEVELGMQQINTMLDFAGTDYVGPLPASLQEYIPFAAGLLAIAKEPGPGKVFLQFVASPEAAPFIRKSGMEPMAQ